MATTKRVAALTPPFILSFPALFEPRANDKGELKYNMNMLFEKKGFDKEAFGKLKLVYANAIPEEWKDAGYEIPGFFKLFKNGDKRPDSGKDPRPENMGRYILSASANEDFPPRLILPNKRPAGRSDLYGGAVCRALLSAYSWAYRKQKDGPVIRRGVSLNIELVQKIKDGEPFGKRLSESDISSYLDEEPLDDADVNELDDEDDF